MFFCRWRIAAVVMACWLHQLRRVSPVRQAEMELGWHNGNVVRWRFSWNVLKYHLGPIETEFLFLPAMLSLARLTGLFDKNDKASSFCFHGFCKNWKAGLICWGDGLPAGSHGSCWPDLRPPQSELVRLYTDKYYSRSEFITLSEYSEYLANVQCTFLDLQ